MQILLSSSNDTILMELGKRLARLRLDRGLTQAEVAREAGIAKRTLERIESGKSGQLASIISICRVLERLEEINAWLPESPPRPLELLHGRGKPRQRAPGRRGKKVDTGWRWGEDTP